MYVAIIVLLVFIGYTAIVYADAPALGWILMGVAAIMAVTKLLSLRDK